MSRAALVVYAPFSLAVARLHCPARLALAHLPPGSPALQCVAPLACPALRGNCLQDRRARTSALRASVACAAYPFGSSALRLRSNWRARGSFAFGVFAILRSPIWLRLRADASSSCMPALSWGSAPNPAGTF